MPLAEIENLLQQPDILVSSVTRTLYEHHQNSPLVQNRISDLTKASAVLFLLGIHYQEKISPSEPCLILTKRSVKVKQAGDLCCPGGGISLPKDQNWAKLLYLPGSPLTRWPFWRKRNKKQRQTYRDTALLLATSLRESYEEMRLNPLRIRFLGVLPIEHLGAFSREIYPVVGWTSQQKRFVLNWEVDKIVNIPLQNLLNPDNYARTRFNMDRIPENTDHLNWNDRPCFIHKYQNESEILWGATFRITMIFLEILFGFKPPLSESLPLIESVLNKNYMSGGRRRS